MSGLNGAQNRAAEGSDAVDYAVAVAAAADDDDDDDDAKCDKNDAGCDDVLNDNKEVKEEGLVFGSVTQNDEVRPVITMATTNINIIVIVIIVIITTTTTTTIIIIITLSRTKSPIM